jgi:hypothetical protein
MPSYITLAELEEIQSNLLGLSRANTETNCALTTLQTDMDVKQQQTIDAIVQFDIQNGNPTSTHEQVKKEMDNKRMKIRNQYKLHDGTSFAQNLDQASSIMEVHGLDQNKVEPSITLFPEDSALRNHVDTFSKTEINQVRNSRPGLTGYIVPGLMAPLPAGSAGTGFL